MNSDVYYLNNKEELGHISENPEKVGCIAILNNKKYKFICSEKIPHGKSNYIHEEKPYLFMDIKSNRKDTILAIWEDENEFRIICILESYNTYTNKI
tara:strand:+ start:462 stop:752 length:291 start_codon:yes stop_codon:yes gene_type:complete